MEWLSDPSVWAGLLTLVVLEIVLGIDNLIFIAILADKLPPHQRERARVVGLSLALLMRLGLLAAMAHLVRLTAPIVEWGQLSLSGRDMILLAGGLFLLWKATTELHERLEGVEHAGPRRGGHAAFGTVLVQIVALDAVFSLDSIITAVGMVDHLPVMMAAVVIAMAVMMLTSRALTAFVNRHPTVVVLCLSFLLMIGLGLVAEGMGFHLPKGYLYAAIGFSILVEGFNQWRLRNIARHAARLPLRERTARAVLRLLGGHGAGPDSAHGPEGPAPAPAFGQEERSMVSGVLSLADRSVLSVMTPRADVDWLDISQDKASLYRQLQAQPHGLFPVCERGGLDAVIGIGRAKDLMADLIGHGTINRHKSLQPPLVVPETVSVIRLMESLRRSRNHLALVSDEYGTILGLVTPMDVLEAIAGEFPDTGEALSVQPVGPEHWLVDGLVDLHTLERALRVDGLAHGAHDASTLAGLLLEHFGELPAPGRTAVLGSLRFEVVAVQERRITRVDVRRDAAPQHPPGG
ncbi:TerC family protein [Paracidovorax anthurii]|uniref:Putative tellurium resistance membrane protein TerC n=1 Tax=Paracidovorax anthurii TaxID=78229 RepID=A0A328ZII2_9BURK|nr:TerC family protein [Paracidovorax anthurii]RAR85669.1 putative tellurium resistance membrane protein TerC [Paracidovorax anthurii]